MRPTIAISAGDPSGIGPEVVIAALKSAVVKRALTPLVFGDASMGPHLPKHVLRAVSELPAKQRAPGKPSPAGGLAQLAYVTAAIECARSGEAQAICTAPVSKEAISATGARFTGHTELLAQAFGAEVLMLMAGPRLRVALATNHLAIKDLPAALTPARLDRVLALLSKTLGAYLGKKNPRLAVCGLNPHAGDGGVLGSEDRDVIAPAIARAKKKGLDVHGPFAADGLFALAARGTFPYDAALAMFHDQGLVATKVLDFERTVNVTLGLPVPRTSPDHGVAYGIAGKKKADPGPMIHALLAAAHAVR